MSRASTKWFVTVTFTAVVVAAGVLSGRKPETLAAQEQRAAPPAPPVPQAEQPERKAQNSPACSPKPFRIGASRPHLYVGPSTVSTPTRIVYVKPEYSESAMAAKVQGIVVLEAQIELDGHVCNPRVLRSIPLLDQSAIDAVLRWRFTPAKVKDMPFRSS